jgi:hypothetical protein
MTDDTAAFAIKGNGGDGILMGQRATTPYAAWIAAGYLPNIGTSHNYPLALQPHGGNVGIGTTAPAQLLHIKSAAPDIRIEDSDGGYVDLNAPGGSLELRADQGNAVGSSKISFWVDATERMLIDSSGALVLNNSGGDAQMYFGGTSGTSRMYLARSGLDSLLFNVSNGNLRFGTNNTERMRIDASGNIGFGVTPNANWSSSYRAIDAFGGATFQFEANSTRQGQNFYGYPWKYKATRTASSIAHTSGGDISFQVAPSGTADSAITWSQAMLIKNGGNVGIGVQSPFSRLQSGGHTFSGGHGMYADGRVGISNHGELTGMMLASTYNDAAHPEYGLVFVQGPTTSNYNVWSISPDGPAKGDSLNFHYQAQSTNIHSPGNVKVTFDGNGNVGIGETVPQSKLHVKSGDSGGTVYNAGYTPLVLENSNHGGLQILTPNNKNGLIYFGDNDNAVSGRIEYLHANDDMIFVTAGNQKASVTAGGSLMMTPAGMSSHNGAVYIIGSVSNYSTANGRYIHVQLSTLVNHMFHIFVEGYTYTTGTRHGRCSGYVYNYAGGNNSATGAGSQPGVYDGRVSGDIVAMYSNQNNARIELVLDTGNTGTGNRWGSFSIYGGADHIVAYTPIEVVQYTTSSAANVRQFSS